MTQTICVLQVRRAVFVSRDAQWHVPERIPQQNMHRRHGRDVLVCTLKSFAGCWCFCPVMSLSEVIDAVPGRVGKTGRRGRGGIDKRRIAGRGSMTYCSPLLTSPHLPHPPSLWHQNPSAYLPICPGQPPQTPLFKAQTPF